MMEQPEIMRLMTIAENTISAAISAAVKRSLPIRESLFFRSIRPLLQKTAYSAGGRRHALILTRYPTAPSVTVQSA